MNSKKIASFTLIALFILSSLAIALPLSKETTYCTFSLYSSTGGTVAAYLDDGSYYLSGIHTVVYGTHVRFVATGSGLYVFNHWTSVSQAGYNTTITGSNTITTNIITSFTLQAFFAPTTQSYTVNLALTQEGGTVAAYLNDGSYLLAGTHTLTAGTQLRLEATAIGAYIFDHWNINSGAGNATSNQATTYLTVSSNFVIQAIFTPQISTYTLSFVDSSDGTIDAMWNDQHHSNGTYTIDAGTTITLYSNPDAGFFFSDFTANGAPFSGSSPSAFIVSTGSDNVVYSVDFVNSSTTDIYYLTLVAGLGGSLSAQYTAAGDSLPSSTSSEGTYQVAYGSSVTFTATPIPGNSFEDLVLTGYWYGAIQTSSFTMTINGNQTCTAQFNNLMGVTPTPGPAGSTTTDEITSFFNWLANQFWHFRVDGYSLGFLIAGGIISFLAVFILLKNIKLWMLGLIFLIIGFSITVYAEPSILGLIIWFAILIGAAIFSMVYSSKGERHGR